MGDDTSDAAWDNLIAWLEGFDPNFRSTLFVRSKWIPGLWIMLCESILFDIVFRSWTRAVYHHRCT